MTNESEQQVTATAEPSSPADFLVNLGKALRESENTDTGLTDILIKHLLTATPAVDAVATAKDAIVKLAVARADPPKLETGNG